MGKTETGKYPAMGAAARPRGGVSVPPVGQGDLTVS